MINISFPRWKQINVKRFGLPMVKKESRPSKQEIRQGGDKCEDFQIKRKLF